jgi:hypothetical protein
LQKRALRGHLLKKNRHLPRHPTAARREGGVGAGGADGH